MKRKVAEIEVELNPEGLTKILLDSVERIDNIVKKEGTDDAE